MSRKRISKKEKKGGIEMNTPIIITAIICITLVVISFLNKK